MRTYLITGDRVSVAESAPAKIPDGVVAAQSIKDLDARRFPIARVISIWNALPGVDPVKRFPSRAAGIKRVWEALLRLPVGIAAARADSKQAKLIALLKRPSGATLKDLTDATGWQEHSVRGVLSGVVKKKLRLALTSQRGPAGTVYRIAS
jgi:hypothetical protein